MSQDQASEGTSRRGFLIRALLGLAITSALVVFLLRDVDLDQIGQLLASSDWRLLLAGLGLWILMYLIRTVRFVLLAPRTPYLTMLSIASVHNFLLWLLPMRTGDLSYGFLVRRAGTAGLGESLLGLLMLRALDATTVVVVFSVALALDRGTYLGDRRLGLVAAGAAVVVGVLLVAGLGRLLRLALRLAAGAVRLLGIQDRPRVKGLLEQAGDSVASFASIGAGVKVKISATSVVQWIVTFAGFYVLMRGFAMPVGFAQTVLGATAAVVTGFLPIGGIGSFGTLEAGWTLGFRLVGLAHTHAVTSGFGVSIVTFGYAALLGLVGWIGLILVSRRQEA